jgi:hypothetical protein
VTLEHKRAAAAALAGNSAKVSVEIAVTAGDATVKKTAQLKIKAPA